jgi:hypothetical protein
MKNSGNSKALSRENTNWTRTIWIEIGLKQSLSDIITQKSSLLKEKRSKPLSRCLMSFWRNIASLKFARRISGW